MPRPVLKLTIFLGKGDGSETSTMTDNGTRGTLEPNTMVEFLDSLSRVSQRRPAG